MKLCHLTVAEKIPKISITAKQLLMKYYSISKKKKILENHQVYYNYRNPYTEEFTFRLINGSLCFFDHCFLNPFTHGGEIMQLKRLH